VGSSDFWNRPVDPSRPAAAAELPTACPACRSLAISTTARKPDENTYWRCGGCGEIWNAARRESRPSNGGYRWR